MDEDFNNLILNAQLKGILDTANKTLSVEQPQLLAQEVQRTETDASAVGPSNQRKRKANRCDDTNCGPPSSPAKRRMRAPNVEPPTQLPAGRFRCACLQWIPLKDEAGFTLTSWVAHLLVCPQARKAGVSYEATKTESIETKAETDDELENQSVSRSTGQPASPGRKSEADSTPTATNEITPQILNETSVIETASNSIPADTEEGKRRKEQSSSHESGRRNTLHLETEPPYKELTPKDESQDRSLIRQRRPNRTESERLKEFQTDPYVAEVEAYRVLCVVCKKWIKLRNNSRYCSIPWECHKAVCLKLYGIPAIRSPSSVASTSTLPTQQYTPTQGNASSHHSASSTSLRPAQFTRFSDSVPPPSSHPSLQPHTSAELFSTTASNTVKVTSGSSGSDATAKERRRARRTGEDQRRTALETHPYTDVVEPDRILCSLCKKWIKLRPKSSYCSAPWHTHIQRCIVRMQKQESGAMKKSNGSPSLPNIDSDGQKHAYYREADKVAQDPDSNDGGASKISYYKPLPVAGPPKGAAGKRRGRPPKNKTQEVKPKRTDDSESEMSYESEEQ
ncbi:hypothetical protein K439DRAFT_1627164 [Ramaria rubella]|nr:hypothetical protein K439DRAFT_1627164 [Ramaria rubella]